MRTNIELVLYALGINKNNFTFDDSYDGPAAFELWYFHVENSTENKVSYDWTRQAEFIEGGKHFV